MGQQLATLKLSYEQLRSLAVETLENAGEGGGWQFQVFFSAIAQQAIKQNFAPDPYAHMNVMGFVQHSLSPADQARVQNILWDLIIEGVIRPGLYDGLNNDLPFFHVTDYGKHVLKDGPTAPYDPDGYLKRLKDVIPDLDPVIETYVNESLHTFRIGCLLSSTVTLGCASEKALILLIATYADYLPADRQAKFKNATENRMIKRQFDEFSKMLDSHLLSVLPAHLKDDLDVALSGVFTLIRNMRNEAGHPTGRTVEREHSYANLVVFPTYLRRVYGLIDWLKEQTT